MNWAFLVMAGPVQTTALHSVYNILWYKTVYFISYKLYDIIYCILYTPTYLNGWEVVAKQEEHNLTVSVNVEGALWSLSEMKYVRRFNTFMQIMLLELNAPGRFCAKWAAAEIMFVAQKSPLHRKCLKDRHPSANSNIDGALPKCWSQM